MWADELTSWRYEDLFAVRLQGERSAKAERWQQHQGLLPSRLLCTSDSVHTHFFTVLRRGLLMGWQGNKCDADSGLPRSSYTTLLFFLASRTYLFKVWRG
jgi:hypothetical protein